MNHFSLDQLRFFVVTAEEGSFASAGKKLFRVQSAIGYGIGKLESDLDVTLFIREKKGLSLTREGEILLEKARQLLQQSNELSQRAKELKNGEETLFSISIDNLFGTERIASLCSKLHRQHPNISLDLHTEILGENIALLLADEVQVAITSFNISEHPDLKRVPIGQIKLCSVVHEHHPLARIPNPTDSILQQHMQIIVRDRSVRTNGTNFSVLSKKNWRVSNMYTKIAFIKNGLGWGNIPQNLIQKELSEGSLIEIHPQPWSHISLAIPMVALHKKSISPSPITQEFIFWSSELLNEEMAPSLV
jgi:DNA-binding transcriptional LysR family regulator